jgi:hypothetical protein
VPLYVSFAVLQTLDMKSTRTAIGDGAREANPVMTGVVGSPAAFFALKAATGAAVVFAAEKMRPRNRVAAMAPWRPSTASTPRSSRTTTP